MSRWVRRGIFSALLLFLGAFLVLFIRLDDEALHQRVITQLEKTTGQTVHGEKARLSLQHGISLKLAKLRIDGGEWRLSADAARFDISPWALLFGDLHVTAIDMVHPVLNLDKGISPKELFASSVVASLLPETSIFSFRQGRLVVDGVAVVDEMAVTVRRIEREQQTTWELQSRYAGGDFSSQGYFRASNSGEDTVFGRISATQLHIDQLQGLPLPSLHYDLLDASLTFSLENEGEWQWFGNLLTRDKHGELPELSWRGKVVGRGLDDFRLHDAFVRFGDNTRLVLLGGCESGQACKAEINTKGANPGLILKALAIDTPLRGKLDGRVDLKQEKTGWQLDGKLGLRGMAWDSTGLPDSAIEISDLHMNSEDDFRLKRANIKPEGEKGYLEVSKLLQAGGKLNLAVRLNSLDTVWAPLADILLHQPDFALQLDDATRLEGQGKLSGSAQWMDSGENSALRFSLTADEASIALDDSFIKPAGIVARVDGLYRHQAENSRLEISELQLGESRLAKLVLNLSTEIPELSLASAQLDMQGLKDQGVLLPGALNGWKGTLVGGLEHVVIPTDAGFLQSLAKADGSLQLKGFGRDGEAWTGDVRLRHGRARTQQMNWQKGTAFVDFDADVNISSMRGVMNINRSGFQWLPEASLPDWLMHADIRGRFGKTDMQWNDNTWKGMQGTYIAQNGRVELNHLRGELADGMVQSRQMFLEGVPGGVRFSGYVGMSGVRLGKVEALADVAGAKMGGFVYLNSTFSGALPLGLKGEGVDSWQGNGDIEIHHGRWKEAKPAHLVQWDNDAAAKLESDAGEGFDRLTTRFKINDSGLQLRRLKFNHGKLFSAGEAKISPAGDISGKLLVSEGEMSYESPLSGRWPSLSNLFFQP